MAPTPTIEAIDLAAGALDYASFVDQHPEAPAAISVVIERGPEDAPVIYLQLQHRAKRADLACLADYANLIEDEVSVHVLRIENPVAFTSVAVAADLGGSQLWVWAHPSAEQLDALWHALGEIPDAGARVEISIEELNEAADAAEDGDRP